MFIKATFLPSGRKFKATCGEPRRQLFSSEISQMSRFLLSAEKVVVLFFLSPSQLAPFSQGRPLDADVDDEGRSFVSR